jgi:hypothetical protein
VTLRARPRAFAVAVVLSGLVLTACGGDGGSAAPTTTRRPAPTTSTTAKPVTVAPFTGLPDGGAAAAKRSSLGVKIENTPEARPQSGLDRADVVYEEVVEGGITRFWAIFSSTAPDVVGPVRSVRSMDPNIILPLGGVVAFSGGTPDNVALVRATGLVTVDEGNAGDAFFRDTSRQAPHNLYARPALLWARGGTPVPPEPLFEYVKKGAELVGEPTASFHVHLQAGYDVAYVWDAGRHGWKRFTQGIEPFMVTGTTPVQVAPTNVIVQFVPYAAGADGNLIGTGEAWIFSNGQLVRGTWTKLYPPAPTVFTDSASKVIALTPGRTWVELAPTGTSVTVVSGTPTGPATTTSTSSP